MTMTIGTVSRAGALALAIVIPAAAGGQSRSGSVAIRTFGGPILRTAGSVAPSGPRVTPVMPVLGSTPGSGMAAGGRVGGLRLVTAGGGTLRGSRAWAGGGRWRTAPFGFPHSWRGRRPATSFCWFDGFIGSPFSAPLCWPGAATFGFALPIPVYVDVPVYGGAVPAVEERRAGRSKIIDVTGSSGDRSLRATSVGDSIVRVTWTGEARGAEEISLFIADSEQRVLVTQTVREAPYTALFETASGIAFVGVSVLYEDGVRTTTLVPYERARR